MTENETQNENHKVFKNMQHAIVEALHELGDSSPYHDNSVRRKELFSRVENASIEVDGVIQNGPHPFSIFNSAICGRRSAAEIFERVEDSERTGAWWRLRIPYDQALQIALDQKGLRAMKQRPRQKSGSRSNDLIQINIQSSINWNKEFVFSTIDKIQALAKRTQEIRDENKDLEEKLNQMTDEISQLKQSCGPDTIEMMKVFLAAQDQVNILRDQVLEAQKHLQLLNKQTMDIQG